MQAQLEIGNSWLDERRVENIFVQGRLKPGVTTAHAQQADSSKAKPKTAKKGMHKKAGKTAAKPAAKDTSKAK